MALLEITIPADRDIELVLEYGGLPKDWNIMSTMQGEPNSVQNIYAWKARIWLPIF